MRLAICDDSPHDCHELERVISELRPQDEVYCHMSGSSLLQAMRGGFRPDCVFVDVLMPEMDGMRLVQAIRGEFVDARTVFVFVTSSEDYAIEAFARNAAHYLVKPVCSADVEEALSRVSSREARRRGISLKTGTERQYLFLDEIALFESSGHAVIATLFDGGEQVRCTQTMESIAQQVGESFLPITRGMLVNPRHIQRMGRRECVLRDGRSVLLSRRRLKYLHDAYDEFVFSQLGRK